MVDACDTLDGVKDGLLENPKRCHFDPNVLLCKGADGPTCLTAPQVAGWDSLTNIRLLDAVEREFGISLSVTEAMGLESVGSLVDVVHGKVAA